MDRLEIIRVALANLPPEYRLIDENGDSIEPDEVNFVGSGGSSVVLRVLHRNKLLRALKLVVPRDDLRNTLDMSHFTDSYENEVTRLSTLNHENLLKITDFSTVRVQEVPYPFVVSEFVKGTDLTSFANDDRTSGSAIVSALRQTAKGLAYLHGERVMHCDLKPDNIRVDSRVSTGSDPLATIIDFGSSKFIPEMAQETEAREYQYLFSTTKYVMSRLRPLVSNWSQNRVSRSELRRYFPYQDLHSFAVIIGELLDIEIIEAKLRHAIGRQGVDGLRLIKERLTNGRPGRPFVQSAAELQTLLGRLSATDQAPLGIEELKHFSARGIVVPTSRGRVATTGHVDAVTSHPVFQRMHLLPQLDLLRYILPGASHSRFAHTMHSYALTQDAINYLTNDFRFRLDVTPELIRQTLFSSLIAPLGHYHFLHMFEDFLEAEDSEPLIANAKLLSDDALIDDVLAEQKHAASEYLGALTDDRGRTIRQVVIDSLELDWNRIRLAQRRPSDPLEATLAALLSSPIDVEKLAYLEDDSVASGIPFGKSVAASALFEALMVPKQSDWEQRKDPNPIMLGIKEVAISYLEDAVLKRYWNIQTGYWHRLNRALQAMVKFQIAQLITCGQLDFSQYVCDTIHRGPDTALHWLDSKFRKAQADGQIDELTVNPMADLLVSRRVIYKRLITISGASRIQNRQPDFKIFERVRGKSPLKDHEVCNLITEVLHGLDASLGIRPGEVLLDIPRARREESGGLVLVYTDDGHQFLDGLFEISALLQGHKESFELNVKRMRIFLHPRVYAQLESANRVSDAYRACLDALRERYAR